MYKVLIRELFTNLLEYTLIFFSFIRRNK